MNNLEDIINGNYFQSYAYSYPHKTAYRPLDKALPLQELWAAEDKSKLFLYLHVPFCEMRCGFCNLFTIANPAEEYESPYLAALTRQAIQAKEAIGNADFARLAIGGGTPTFLNIKDLEKMFQLIHDTMGLQQKAIPCSVEMSPKTAEAEKLALLREKGTTRASIGVQSFILEETKALGRPQKKEEVLKALDKIKDSGIPELNIDLIYGTDGQSFASWQYSIEAAMNYEPTEIFFYPLYVRPLTGLGLKEKEWNDFRIALYRYGRDFLLNNGYEQHSMRLFRRKAAPVEVAPPYNLVEDGMLGLGVGARSYTKNFHYSSEFAVSRSGVKNIIHDFNEKTEAQFAMADYGVFLEEEEQKRRYVIKSLLEGGGFEIQRYETYFGTSLMEDLPQLEFLYQNDLVLNKEGRLELNIKGLELSDVLGQWLYSEAMKEKMVGFALH